MKRQIQAVLYRAWAPCPTYAVKTPLRMTRIWRLGFQPNCGRQVVWLGGLILCGLGSGIKRRDAEIAEVLLCSGRVETELVEPSLRRLEIWERGPRAILANDLGRWLDMKVGFLTKLRTTGLQMMGLRRMRCRVSGEAKMATFPSPRAAGPLRRRARGPRFIASTAWAPLDLPKQ